MHSEGDLSPPPATYRLHPCPALSPGRSALPSSIKHGNMAALSVVNAVAPTLSLTLPSSTVRFCTVRTASLVLSPPALSAPHRVGLLFQLSFDGMKTLKKLIKQLALAYCHCHCLRLCLLDCEIRLFSASPPPKLTRSVWALRAVGAHGGGGEGPRGINCGGRGGGVGDYLMGDGIVRGPGPGSSSPHFSTPTPTTPATVGSENILTSTLAASSVDVDNLSLPDDISRSFICLCPHNPALKTVELCRVRRHNHVSRGFAWYGTVSSDNRVTRVPPENIDNIRAVGINAVLGWHVSDRLAGASCRGKSDEEQHFSRSKSRKCAVLKCSVGLALGKVIRPPPPPLTDASLQVYSSGSQVIYLSTVDVHKVRRTGQCHRLGNQRNNSRKNYGGTFVPVSKWLFPIPFRLKALPDTSYLIAICHLSSSASPAVLSSFTFPDDLL
ncbi:hypothetical protein J6590_043793 [Homalodisca vitripennis]|nr:hypothetical protein J6590_043793 [Homalodisca vitripennis]